MGEQGGSLPFDVGGVLRSIYSETKARLGFTDLPETTQFHPIDVNMKSPEVSRPAETRIDFPAPGARLDSSVLTPPQGGELASFASQLPPDFELPFPLEDRGGSTPLERLERSLQYAQSEIERQYFETIMQEQGGFKSVLPTTNIMPVSSLFGRPFTTTSVIRIEKPVVELTPQATQEAEPRYLFQQDDASHKNVPVLCKNRVNHGHNHQPKRCRHSHTVFCGKCWSVCPNC
eukprot:TRINITY_DN10305_c0_g1_i1.p1 TRINITY_DN10305_c0_g1~~TRINITY_DN10305_c0_g1_i1.p1  ORF type:complete len:232 (-),score=27.63 TRINITY_DN10305_c0_g1_i1:92-787(-)